MKFIAENKKRKIATKKGYSLVEVLVSLIILSIGLLGVVYLMNTNIKSSQNSRNQIIASELAQEGVELVYNIKANNSAASPLANLAINGTAQINNCRIDYRATNANWTVNTGTGTNCDSANVTNSGNFYTLFQKNGFYTTDSSGTPTKFARKIAIQVQNSSGGSVNPEDPTAYQIRVYSIVTWNNTYQVSATCTVANDCVWVTSIIPK